MPIVDLAFKLTGSSIPLDYGYALFGALCRIVPELHGDRDVGVHPIRGVCHEPRRLHLVPGSMLRLRLRSEEIGRYLALAGRALDLDGSRLGVGIPRVESLTTAPRLASRLATIGRLTEPEPVLASLRAQMAGLGIEGDLELLPSPDPERLGQPARRVLRIKGRRIVGYGVSASGLTAEGSLLLQEQGLGSRRRMGCGIFTPPGGSQDR